MIKPEPGSNVMPIEVLPDPGDGLPYTVELWVLADASQRVLGRATSMVLARALFDAARIDFPNDRITLRRGHETLLDSH